MWAEIDVCPINNVMPEMIRTIAADKGLGLVDAQAAFVDAYGAASGRRLGDVLEHGPLGGPGPSSRPRAGCDCGCGA